MNHRFLTAAAASLLAGALVSVPTGAQAAPPAVESFDETFSFVAVDFCAFSVTLTVHNVATETTHPTADGYDQIANITEVDTFSANGRTVVGTPYGYTVHRTIDAAGNQVSAVATGVMWSFRLPDGTLVHGAGSNNFLTGHVVGAQADFTPLCAYLAG